MPRKTAKAGSFKTVVVPGYSPARAVLTRAAHGGRLDCGHSSSYGGQIGFDPRSRTAVCARCHYDMAHEPSTAQAMKGGGY